MLQCGKKSCFNFIIHHFHIDHNASCLPPPKFCITIVSNFSWVLQSSQEKSKTMVIQFFFLWGGDKVLYGLCENGEFLFFMHIYLSVSFLQE